MSHALSSAALEGWKNDPVFKPYFHPTGYILAATSAEALQRLNEEELPEDKSGYIELKSAEDFRGTMPDGVLQGEFPGWKGWWKKSGAGWVHARKALVSAAREAERTGVKFVTGSPRGAVTSLLYSGPENKGRVLGVKTADDQSHTADLTILTSGAVAPQLIDLKFQLRPTAWTLSHIRMSPSESQIFRNLPVLFNIEKGFFMEPDDENHDLKICDEHPGYTNFLPDPNSPTGKSSVPFRKEQVPIEAEARVRDFLRETMPQLADRPFSFARICWCADTPDRKFLITRHPEHEGVVLGIGGSGHGYMHIPSIGGYVADAVEEKLEERMSRSFGWRPEMVRDGRWVEETLGRFGGPNRVMDFQVDVQGWTEIPEPKAA